MSDEQPNVSPPRETAPAPADAADITIPAMPEPVGIEPGNASNDTPKRGRGRPPGAKNKPKGDAAPPRRPAGRPSTADTTERRVAREMTSMYEMVASLLLGLGFLSPRAAMMGAVIEQNAGKIGDAYGKWAASNQKVAAMLDRLSFGGGIAGVAIAHAPILFALQAPTPPPGTSPADAEMMGGMMSMLGNLFENVMAQDPDGQAA